MSKVILSFHSEHDTLKILLFHRSFIVFLLKQMGKFVFLCNFAVAIRKECKDIKLDSRTITTVLATSEHTLLGLPLSGRRFPIYVCGLW